MSLFVHHVSEQLRVSSITTRIRGDLDEASKTLYPDQIGEPYDGNTPDEELIATIEERAEDVAIVRSCHGGYLQNIYESEIAEYIEEPVMAIRVEPAYGTFLFKHEVVATVFLKTSRENVDEDRFSQLGEECFPVSATPPLRANSQLAVQQLVDVALRALSSGVNDPSTARQVLEELSDWLALMAQRQFPSRVRSVDGRVLILPQTSFDDYVHQVFAQIREAASVGSNLLHNIAEMLEKLLETDPPKAQLRAFGDQLSVLKEETDQIANPVERERLVKRVEALLEAVDMHISDSSGGDVSEVAHR